MKYMQCGIFPFAAEVAGGGHGSDVRPVTAAAAVPALFGAGGGRKLAGLVGSRRLSGPPGPLGRLCQKP
jgi:hypothetical protein